MALPFRRSPRPSQEGAPLCSAPTPEQRTWRVNVILSSLSPVVREALKGWLLEPTDLNRWPPPATFSHQRSPLQWWETHGQTVASILDLLLDELKVMRQTVDFPPEALSGLTHNGLLIVHGIRLRQLERWLQPERAAREIKRLTGQR